MKANPKKTFSFFKRLVFLAAALTFVAITHVFGQGSGTVTGGSSSASPTLPGPINMPPSMPNPGAGNPPANDQPFPSGVGNSESPNDTLGGNPMPAPGIAQPLPNIPEPAPNNPPPASGLPTPAEPNAGAPGNESDSQ